MDVKEEEKKNSNSISNIPIRKFWTSYFNQHSSIENKNLKELKKEKKKTSLSK